MNEKEIVLTGIKPTGYPHLGNYLGAIKPALELARQYENSQLFIANYHSLNLIKDAELLSTLTLDVACTWLACGLDPSNTLFYCQSDVPEVFEVATILAPFTPKGLLNRAHAYKSQKEKNLSASLPEDSGVNMGLYVYPLLMAADILTFGATLIPVGKDQKQHVEICAEIARSVNLSCGENTLVVPKALISKEVGVIPGIDGRKMSKSYGNVIPLFKPKAQVRKACMKIVTNSQGVDEVKTAEDSTIFQIYALLATESEKAALKKLYQSGHMGWGEAKEILFEKIWSEVGPLQERYNMYHDDPSQVFSLLKEGAARAREQGGRILRGLKEALKMPV